MPKGSSLPTSIASFESYFETLAHYKRELTFMCALVCIWCISKRKKLCWGTFIKEELVDLVPIHYSQFHRGIKLLLAHYMLRSRSSRVLVTFWSNEWDLVGIYYSQSYELFLMFLRSLVHKVSILMVEDQPCMGICPFGESRMLNLRFESIGAMQRHQVTL